MEEAEDPTENVREKLHETAAEAREHWIMAVALTSALLAALAAISSLFSGHHANEALIDQIRAADQWNYYQAKGIKETVLASRIELLTTLGHAASPAEQQKLAEYRQQQTEISKEASAREAESEHHLRHHVILSRAVTLFQVAIAVAAISVLTRRRNFWFVSLAFGLLGCFFMAQGFLVGS